MIFTKPKLDDIYRTLKNNDRLISALHGEELLLTRELLIDIYTESTLNTMDAAIYMDNVTTLYGVAQVLLDNEEYIKSNTIDMLITNKIAFEDLAKAFARPTLPTEIYKEIFFCFKYCYATSFFQNNLEYFLPEY